MGETGLSEGRGSEDQGASLGAAPRYWAFLSYSHQDQKWAEWLHRRLEGFAVPRRFVGLATGAGPAPRRFRPVFRDLEELEVAADLNEKLRTAAIDLGKAGKLVGK